MDWALLPPEINSLRMYTGPGAQPLMTAASAWESLATELSSTAASFGATVDGLSAVWLGPSAISMRTTAMTYQSWLTLTAEKAQQTASQAMAAVAAYETAFIATVPPAEVAANRALLAMLVATNFLGINTPAIMATEAQYIEMWAQDVAAMFGYQAGSAQAMALPTFTPPAALTSPVQVNPILAGLGNIFMPGSNMQTGGLAGLLNLFSNSNGSAFGSIINSTLSNSTFSSGFYYGLPEGGLQALTSMFSISSLLNAGQGQNQAQVSQGCCCPLPTYPIPTDNPIQTFPIQPEVAMGQAPSVGQLSVPQTWARSAPNVFSKTEQFIPLNTDEAPFLGVPGVPLLGGRREKPEPARYGFPVKIMQRHTAGG
jgi:PPE-repeat protein